MELQGRVKELQDRGLGLAVISYDSRETLAAFTDQHGITFPLLSDADSATIKRYGILNTVVAEALGPRRDDPAVKAAAQKYISAASTPKPSMMGIPFPGTFIVDRQRRVTARFFEDFSFERNTVSSILKRVGSSEGAISGTKVATAHLNLVTYTSDAAVAPGNRFALILEVTPKSGMHVYAPGASSYRIVSVSLAPQAFVRVPPLEYPPSEIYHFKPLDEHVPIYEKPFTLVQEVVVDGDPAAQAGLKGKEGLTFSGRFDYQACDDELCFNPVSIPLSWTVQLRPLIRPVR